MYLAVQDLSLLLLYTDVCFVAFSIHGFL